MLDQPHNSTAQVTVARPGKPRPAIRAHAALALIHETSWKSRLVRGAAGILLLRVSLACITLVSNIVLVRWLGTTEYGAYAYSLAWLVVLSVPALLGLDQFLIRSVAAHQARSEWGALRALVRRANWAVGVTAISLALVAGGVAWIVTGPSETPLLATFLVALILLPLITLTRVRQAVLLGLHHVILSQLPETILQPLVLLALLVCAGLMGGAPLSAPGVMALNVLATVFALLVGVMLLLRRLPCASAETPPTRGDWSWLRSSLPLMCFTAISVLTAQIDLLILGAQKDPQAVGIYSVVVRTGELVAFVLQAINPAVAPHLASLYAVGDFPGLQRLVTMAARITLVAAMPIGLGLIFGGAWVLQFLYGPDLVQGHTALAILSIGQLVNVGMGSVGLVLTMTGHERDALFCIGISGVLNLVLSVLLIPSWGVQGAAVAGSASLILWNILMAFAAYRRLGIRCGALARVPA